MRMSHRAPASRGPRVKVGPTKGPSLFDDDPDPMDFEVDEDWLGWWGGMEYP